ncbi:MAG: GGDEF domain-containing protein [Tissierellaceae bacterium]
MEVHTGAPHETGSQTKMVEIFVKRVNITFFLIMFFGAVAIFSLIYLPLSRSLEKSITDNFSQSFTVKYASLQGDMERALEGAKSLRSRTMIKNALVEYESDLIGLGELKEYTQSKYQDGASILEHLLRADRVIGRELIARYSSKEELTEGCNLEAYSAEGEAMESEICRIDDKIYFMVRSPIVHNGKVLANDSLIFDFTNQIHNLCTATVKLGLLDRDEFDDLVSGGRILREEDNIYSFTNEGYYYQAVAIQNDFYYYSRVKEDLLFAPIKQLDTQLFAAAFVILLTFIAIIYLYVVSFAKGVLMNLEDSHYSLSRAVREAQYDPLTRIGSRRYGERLLIEAFSEFKIRGVSPAIMMFDIDNLKDINDSYGHFAGDQVLKQKVDMVKKNIRKDDSLFRWGGDEFIGILKDLEENSVKPFSRKILEAVSDAKVDLGMKEIRATISMGVSYFREGDSSFFDALNRADEAMYKSKSKGKNDIEIL